MNSDLVLYLSSYRPRTYYVGRLCFHRCLSVNRGGGVPQPLVSPMSLPSIWSQVLSGGGGTPASGPRSFLGHTPVLLQVLLGGGTPFRSQVLTRGQSWLGGGYPGHPQPGMGYPPAGYAAGGIPLAVSRRRTFFFFIWRVA